MELKTALEPVKPYGYERDENGDRYIPSSGADVWDYGRYRGVLLLDLDDTLVRTNRIAHLRSQGRWGEALRSFSQTSLPPKTRLFLRYVEREFGSDAAVVTSSPRLYAEKLLRHHRIELPVVVAYHDTDRHKPDPAPILQAAMRLGVSPKRCLYIGDQADDVWAAFAAGSDSIGLNWESPDAFGTVGELALSVFTDWDDVFAYLYCIGIHEGLGLDEYWLREKHTSETIGSDEARHEDRSDEWPHASTSNYTDHLDMTWDGDDIAIFKYRPLGRSATAVTNLILDYKNNVPGAVDLVNQFAISAVEKLESKLLGDQERVSIVGIPSHYPGPCGAHLRSTCEALIDHFDWLDDLIDSLVRTQSVPSAARSRPSERPTRATHLETIVYDDPSEPEDSLPPTRNPDAPRTGPSLIRGPVIPSIGMQMSRRGQLGRVISVESSGVVLRLEKSRKVAGKWVNVIPIKWGHEVWARGFSTERVGALTPKQRSIIMVDDVMTTGATSGAARQKLQVAGYGVVFGLFMARTE